MTRRVLYVNTPTYIGGAELSLLTLMEHVGRDLFEPHLLTSGCGPLLERARAAGIACSTQEFPWLSRRRPWRYLASIAQLVQLVRRERINLVHTNCDHSLGYVRWASRITGVPYISHVRDFTRSWFEPGKVEALNRAARVVANSRATAQACTQAGVAAPRTVVIYNPINTRVFRSVAAEVRPRLRQDLGIASDALVIGIVGQVLSIKGHGEFVAAASSVAERIPGAHFLVVGTAPPGDDAKTFAIDVERRVRQSPLANRFSFTGFREDVPELMATLDVLAVPSWYEPFGRVAVEGMAAGCAVVGTNAGGLPEIITHEVDGILVPPHAADALASALIRLGADAQLRARLADNGRRSAERFAPEYHTNQMQALYTTVLDGALSSA